MQVPGTGVSSEDEENRYRHTGITKMNKTIKPHLSHLHMALDTHILSMRKKNKKAWCCTKIKIRMIISFDFLEVKKILSKMFAWNGIQNETQQTGAGALPFSHCDHCEILLSASVPLVT